MPLGVEPVPPDGDGVLMPCSPAVSVTWETASEADSFIASAASIAGCDAHGDAGQVGHVRTPR